MSYVTNKPSMIHTKRQGKKRLLSVMSIIYEYFRPRFRAPGLLRGAPGKAGRSANILPYPVYWWSITTFLNSYLFFISCLQIVTYYRYITYETLRLVSQ